MNNKIVNEEAISMFVPLKGLLLEDTEKIKQIKSLYQKEEEYADLLGPIEYSIACFYLDNKKLRDAEVIKMLRKIKQNYDKDLDYFDNELEKMIMISSSLSLQKKKRTKHEFILALSYILWAIDNRRYLGSKGYLNWLLEFFSGKLGLGNKEDYLVGNLDGLSEKEKEDALQFAQKHFNKGRANDFTSVSPEEIEESRKESEMFARDLGNNLFKVHMEKINPAEMPEKMKTFHMSHDEDMNYNCKKCNKRISAHNRDWHNKMCDLCFDNSPEDDN